MTRTLTSLVDSFRKLLPGSSLLREAKREQVRAGGIGRTERAVGWTKSKLRTAFETSRYAFIWILLVGLAGLYLVPGEIRVWRLHLPLSLFKDPSNAAEFLRALWQVEASVLALSITVIIFAFQAVSSRHNIKLYEFAEDVHLFPIFYVGVVGLIVNGLTLLSLANGAPAGGAASWAVLVSGSAFPLLAWLFASTVRALDPDELHRRRLTRIREETYRAAEQEIFETFARDLLERLCSEANVECRPFLAGSPLPGSKEIAAPRSGYVYDIDPKKLRSLTEEGYSGVKLLVDAGAAVAKDQTIIVLPPGCATGKAAKRARQVVRVRGGRGLRRDTLSEAADRLHEEAVEAIRGGSLGRYEEVLDAYQEALLAFPTAWVRYGERFDYQAARGSNLLGIGQTERFLMNMGSELREAANSDVRDIAFSAAYMPTRIARRAFELDAIELSRRALRLSLFVYTAVGRGPTTEIAENVKELTWRYLYEFANYCLASYVKERGGVSREEQPSAEEFLRQVFANYNSLLKEMVELRDLQTLREADRSWSRILRYWEPEYEEPFEERVDAMARELGEENNRVREVRQQLEAKRHRVAVKEELFGLRTAYRFGLCFWALRRLHEAEVPSEWVPVFEYLASNFISVEQIVRAFRVARAADAEHTMPWSSWILSDLPQEEMHFIDADPDILRTFVALMLLSTDLEGQASFTEPLEGMPIPLEQAEKVLDEVLQDEALKNHLLPSEELLQERAEVLSTALRLTGQEQKELEEEKIREAPLAPQKVENFKRILREGWLENRLAVSLFRLVGAYEELSEGSPSDVEWFGIREWLSKDMFVPEPAVYGVESLANQYGVNLTSREVGQLLTKLSTSPADGDDARPVSERIRSTVGQMVDAGYSPSVILAPISWRLMRAMDIEGGPRQRNDPSPPEGISLEGARRNFRGQIEGVPDFELSRIPKDRIWVVDLAAFATWRQWFVDEEGEYLRIEFEDIDEEQAFNLARENPNMLKSDGRESVPERAAAIRSLVYFEVLERFEIKLKDQKAVRVLDIPDVPEALH
jgi:hypothetical protein